MANWCSNTLTVKPTNGSKKALTQLKKFIDDVNDKGTVIPAKEARKHRDKHLKENFDKTYRDNADLYVKHKEMPIDEFMEGVLYFEKILGKEFIKDRQALSMDKILPCPKELLSVTSPVRAENGEDEEQFKARVKRHKKEYGAEDWYQWNCQNYGTKWDVTEVSTEETDNEITYSFSTAWSPPKEFLANICGNYPLLNFQLNYEEPGMAFQGEYIAEAGEEVSDVCEEMEQKETCSDCGEELEDGEDVDEEGRCTSCHKSHEEEDNEEDL